MLILRYTSLYALEAEARLWIAQGEQIFDFRQSVLHRLMSVFP